MSCQLLSTEPVAAASLRRASEFALLATAIFLLGLLSGVPVTGASTAAASPDDAAGSGLRPITQSALATLLAKTARELHVPGAVVLLRTPQGELTATYGTTQLGSTIRPRAYTHFRIASITKTMTSAVILQLAQEGKLRLRDRISKYVSGVPNGHNITLAELLEMRSGLYDYISAPEMAGFFDHHPTKVWTPARTAGDRIRAAAQLPTGYSL